MATAAQLQQSVVNAQANLIQAQQTVQANPNDPAAQQALGAAQAQLQNATADLNARQQANAARAQARAHQAHAPAPAPAAPAAPAALAAPVPAAPATPAPANPNNGGNIVNNIGRNIFYVVLALCALMLAFWLTVGGGLSQFANSGNKSTELTGQIQVTGLGQNTNLAGNGAVPSMDTSGVTNVGTGSCAVMKDYQLKDLTEVATSGSFIHVEYFTKGTPEYETIVPAQDYVGGRFTLTTAFPGGHVWEYPAGCTFDQVKTQVDAHIARRIAGGANNGGYVDWLKAGFFTPTGAKN